MTRRDRWLYGWALGYVAIGAASLLVPLFAIDLGASAVVVGLIAASAAFAGVPGALLWGSLVSRTHRRRPFVLVALALTAGVLALLPLASTPMVVLALNAVLWFVVAAAAPVLNLIVVEGHPESVWDARIGTLNAYQGYGWVGGLLAGTAWTLVVPRLVPSLDPLARQRLFFLALASVAALAFVVTRVWYPEPATVSAERFQRVYRRLRRDGWGAGRALRTLPYGTSRIYWGLLSLRPGALSGAVERYGRPLSAYLLAATLFSVGFAVFWGPMPAYLTSPVGAALDTDAVFVLFMLANAGSAVAYVPVGQQAGKRDPRRLQLSALVARVVLFPLVAVVGAVVAALGLGAMGGVTVLGLCFLLIGVTWAVIAVTAAGLVTRLADERVRGEALGAYGALVGVGTGVGSALGGVVATGAGYLVAFALAGVFVLAGALIVAVR